jgi:hypothetical protein
MTEFVLRIFFSGLIALIPNADGTELNVLLVNTPHSYSLADGTCMATHTPLLVARAASCENCETDEGVAEFLYAGKTATEAQRALAGAVSGGAAWRLAGSDLTLAGATQPLTLVQNARTSDATGQLQKVPTTAAEREDFSWVASMRDIAPGVGGFQSALRSDEPLSPCTIAARLKLRSGRVFTYSLTKVDGKARPIHFLTPSGTNPAPYHQAVANWVAAEIRVPGDMIEIVEQKFNDTSARRSMKLHPLNGNVEIALLNLPPFVAPGPNSPTPLPAPGQHFQIYYDLVRRPPARANRLVPHSSVAESEPQTDWADLHPKLTLWSELLEQLNLSPRGKAPYDLALCPIVRD